MFIFALILKNIYTASLTKFSISSFLLKILKFWRKLLKYSWHWTLFGYTTRNNICLFKSFIHSPTVPTAYCCEQGFWVLTNIKKTKKVTGFFALMRRWEFVYANIRGDYSSIPSSYLSFRFLYFHHIISYLFHIFNALWVVF